MKDSCHSLSTDEVVVQVRIHVGGLLDSLPTWWRCILWEVLLGPCIAGVEPIVLVLLLLQFREVRLFCTKPDDAILHLVQVTNDAFGPVEMSLSRCRSEP